MIKRKFLSRQKDKSFEKSWKPGLGPLAQDSKYVFQGEAPKAGKNELSLRSHQLGSRVRPELAEITTENDQNVK
ncbi:unnamed protein product [Allacma fusca]|uniref:Uncharacterized protein n=1 Tax=Allacma fusca TaxID=39272 RepID=A0A8J2JCI8_9HEXA|nr:unnamed protein product [Allacma fusca]